MYRQTEVTTIVSEKTPLGKVGEVSFQSRSSLVLFRTIRQTKRKIHKEGMKRYDSV
jgi:hypothetical protein